MLKLNSEINIQHVTKTCCYNDISIILIIGTNDNETIITINGQSSAIHSGSTLKHADVSLTESDYSTKI